MSHTQFQKDIARAEMVMPMEAMADKEPWRRGRRIIAVLLLSRPTDTPWIMLVAMPSRTTCFMDSVPLVGSV